MPKPLAIIREAIRAVPAVKYALGIGGIIAVIALVFSLQIDLKVAIFGTVVMLVLMGVLVIFAKMASMRSLRFFVGPIRVFTWFVLVLFMMVAFSLFTSVFFKIPVDLQDLLKLNSPSRSLNSPQLSYPYDNTIFDNFPRTTTLRWLPVRNATHYEIEVQYQLPSNGQWFNLPNYPVSVETDNYTIEFVGAQPGRWGVTALSSNQNRSQPSEWWYFRYTR